MCSATSNVLFSAGSFTMSHPSAHGTRIKWPLLETGANSVIPWTMPRMMACRMVTGRESTRGLSRSPVWATHSRMAFL